MHSCVIHRQSAQMSFSSFLSSFFSFVFSFSLSLLFSFSFSFSFLSFLLSLTFHALELHWQETLQAKNVLALKVFWAASLTRLGARFQDVCSTLESLASFFSSLGSLATSWRSAAVPSSSLQRLTKEMMVLEVFCLGFCPWFFWQLQLPLASFLQERHSSPPAWRRKCTHTNRLSRSTRSSPKLQCPNAK